MDFISFNAERFSGRLCTTSLKPRIRSAQMWIGRTPPQQAVARRRAPRREEPNIESRARSKLATFAFQLQQSFCGRRNGVRRSFAWQQSSGPNAALGQKRTSAHTRVTCPLYPQKRTLVERVAMSPSAKSGHSVGRRANLPDTINACRCRRLPATSPALDRARSSRASAEAGTRPISNVIV
jgi:hypothetical protein